MICCHDELPEWDDSVPLIRVVNSRNSSNRPNCTVMVLTGISHPAFLFYGLKRNTDYPPYSPRIKALSSERAVPSVSAKHFREYMLESEGNILLGFPHL
ncbi:hypothetical protein COLO4_32418 [Corchorus olitorius]|uniref:Uncharacterized protein n=1 Tax=Corchorus olitorius TaxID=93759 RepID=A0A1R3GZB5_9ROSI|nr:hypothetical protein COLO4_32418 [Corchorus olitorius]